MNFDQKASSLGINVAHLPQVLFAKKKLQEKMTNHSQFLSDEAYLSIEKGLLKRLNLLCTPTLIAELRVRKSESLFWNEQHFLNETMLLPKNGKLNELVLLVCGQWIEQMVLFFERYRKDVNDLEKTFGTFGKIIQLDLNQGDPHHNGQSVIMAQFENEMRIFYKPRSVEVEKRFNHFLEEINLLAPSLPLKTYHILSGKDYGWVEMIPHKPCQNLEDVNRYFFRIGMLLSLIFLLDGSDITFENMIAHGEHPVIIDLETLFQTKVIDHAKVRSVLTTHILPLYLIETGGKQIDVSALSEFLGDSKHHVVLDQKVIKAKEQVEYIRQGFKEMYGIVQQNRELILQTKGIKGFAGAPIRTIVRKTSFYSALLRRLIQPQALKNVRFTQSILDLLAALPNVDESFRKSIVEEEKRALLRGDIPYFYSFPESRDLYSQSGLIAKNIFAEAPIERVVDRIKEMDEELMYVQEKLIQRSFEEHFTEIP